MLGIREPSAVHNVHVISQGTFEKLFWKWRYVPTNLPLFSPLSPLLCLFLEHIQILSVLDSLKLKLGSFFFFFLIKVSHLLFKDRHF